MRTTPPTPLLPRPPFAILALLKRLWLVFSNHVLVMILIAMATEMTTPATLLPRPPCAILSHLVLLWPLLLLHF
jgi:hypothetical protein